MQVSGAPPKSQLRRATQSHGWALVVAELMAKLLPKPQPRSTTRKCLLGMRTMLRYEDAKHYGSHLKRLESQPCTILCVNSFQKSQNDDRKEDLTGGPDTRNSGLLTDEVTFSEQVAG